MLSPSIRDRFFPGCATARRIFPSHISEFLPLQTDGPGKLLPPPVPAIQFHKFVQIISLNIIRFDPFQPVQLAPLSEF